MDKILINISRQYGSEGRKVAGAVASKLGIDIYDYRFIYEAAEHSGMSPEVFKMEGTRKKFFYFGYFQNSINDEGLFALQSETIRKLASRDSAVFVGRAADYVLRDMHCMDVFICAPMKWRKELVSQRSQLSIEEAEKLIIKEDKYRETWYNFFTLGNWGVASNYDLCVDSSILGIEGTADFIIEFGIRSGFIPKDVVIKP